MHGEERVGCDVLFGYVEWKVMSVTVDLYARWRGKDERQAL